MQTWRDFILACTYWRERLFPARSLSRNLLLVVALLLCCSPLSMDLGITLYSLGMDTVLLLLDMQLALLLGMLWTGVSGIKRWRGRDRSSP